MKTKLEQNRQMISYQDFLLKLKDNFRHWNDWTTKRCPYCGNDILYPSDLWRHENKMCMTNSQSLEEIEENINSTLEIKTEEF